jgi:heterodisulfide reductase subunit B
MEIEITTKLADRIRQATGQNVYLCYQCVKCTAGCPLAEHFDLAPNQVMRATQLGMEDIIFDSRTPWLCASCQTCTTRCPQSIDIARVMDFVVGEAITEGIKPKVPEVAIFNKVFLRDVNILGRAYELGLIAEMMLRTRQPLKDIGQDIVLGLEMFKHRKINLLPELVRRRRPKVSPPASRPSNEIGYYPGCSLHSMAKEFDHSARSVLESLGLKPHTPKGWICCGSSPAHRVDHHLSVQMPMESLMLFEQEGHKELTLPCAMCFNRFRSAARDMRLDPDLKQDIDRELDHEYKDSIEISSLLDFIVDRVGLEAISEKVQQPLKDLKVACYYGCLLTRPPEVTGSEEHEYPMAMDRLMKTLGATYVDWDRKVACCGASLSLTQTDLVLEMSGDILENARARGADAVIVACPMCHSNMDGRQTQMGDTPRIPVLYFTQLMALAFGKPDDAALKYNLIDPRPLLKEHGLL